MTRLEHLKFCRICTYQKKDFNLGLVCSFSGAIADFEGECATFKEDVRLRMRMDVQNTALFLEGRLANKRKRFVNFIIDQLFLLGLALIIGTLIGILLVYYFPSYKYLINEENKLRDYLLGFTIALLYYSFFEGFTGRSLGKFFTKTKVITEDGKKPPFGAIFLRSLCRHIPFDHFSFLGNDSVGWHDKFSKTRVVEID